MKHVIDEADIYGNTLVLSPQKEKMFMTNSKRRDWYLKRGLATVIDKETIQLTFQPKGNGHNGDLFYTSRRENICCACGENQQLTKHHVVPYLFRKAFPNKLKKGNSHDILLLCDSCHKCYNKMSYNLIRDLEEELGVKFEEGMEWRPHEYKIAKTLLKHGDQIPKERLDKLYETIQDFLEKDKITDDDLRSVVSEYPEKMSGELRKERRANRVFVKKAMERYSSNEFSVLWRRHFVDTMKPKHLPTGWDVEYQLIDYNGDR